MRPLESHELRALASMEESAGNWGAYRQFATDAATVAINEARPAESRAVFSSRQARPDAEANHRRRVPLFSSKSRRGDFIIYGIVAGLASLGGWLVLSGDHPDAPKPTEIARSLDTSTGNPVFQIPQSPPRARPLIR